MEVCSSASLLGQQLTLVELERLSFIGPEEFVQAFAKDSPHIDSSFKDMKKTKNLESYVHWFNRLSYLVASEICKVSSLAFGYIIIVLSLKSIIIIIIILVDIFASRFSCFSIPKKSSV